jgi:putative endonuclease
MKQFLRSWHNGWFGWIGERAAARYLKKQGMRVLTRGFRTRWGEIDLIARDRDTLVFVEVKTRRRGEPAEAVTPEKQKRLTRAAFQFLRRHRLLEPSVPSRFDVVAIVWPDDRSKPRIQHIPNAFEAVSDC